MLLLWAPIRLHTSLHSINIFNSDRIWKCEDIWNQVGQTENYCDDPSVACLLFVWALLTVYRGLCFLANRALDDYNFRDYWPLAIDRRTM